VNVPALQKIMMEFARENERQEVRLLPLNLFGFALELISKMCV
jgi:hypothetical protein